MKKALGMIETIGLVPAIEAADAAVKAANVILLGYSNTKGGGKITVKVVGDVGAVQAAVAAGVAAAARIGKVYGHSVIPRPHEEINAMINGVDRGGALDEPESSSESEPAPTPSQLPPEGEKVKPARCAAITKSGEQCKMPARPGSIYCNFHRRLEKGGQE